MTERNNLTFNLVVYMVIVRQPGITRQALGERFVGVPVDLTRILRRGCRNGVLELRNDGYHLADSHPLASVIRKVSETG